MNIFNKAALQGMKKNRTRTLVTIIGVILSTAMITAVATFGVSLLHYMVNGAVQKYGNWHVAFLDADAAFVQEQALNPDVMDTVTFENLGYASFENGKNPEKPYFFIAGFNQKTFDSLPSELLSGRLPENDKEILISAKSASEGGASYGLGDVISLEIGTRMGQDGALCQNTPYTPDNETLIPKQTRRYTVVGICRTPVFEQDTSPGYSLITRTDSGNTSENPSLAEADNTGNTVTVFAALRNPRHFQSYVDSVSAGHAYILNHDVLRFMGVSDDPSDRLFNALLYMAGGIVVAIIMIGSIFLIYNAFSISLNERTQQIGILASVGATAKQLLHSVLFEGLCIGAAGIPIGILIGIGSIGIVILVVSKRFGSIFYSDVPLTLYISPFAIAGAAAVSIVTILISAYIPAKKASRRPVMECIRQTNEVKVDSKAVKTSNFAQHLYGLEGVLALKNFKRNKKRYRSIVLSLILSIVLFISTSALVLDLQKISKHANEFTDYDIGFGMQDIDDSKMLNLYGQLKNCSGVYESTYQTFLYSSCIVDANALSEDYWKSVREISEAPEDTAGIRTEDGRINLPMEIQFLDDHSYLKLIKQLDLPPAEYDGKNGKLIAVAKMKDDSNEADGVHQLKDLFIDSALEVLLPSHDGESGMGQGQTISLTFAEFIPPDTAPMTGSTIQRPYDLRVIAPWSLKEKLVPADNQADIVVKGLTFQTKDPAKSASEMSDVIQNAGLTSPYILMNATDMLDENRNLVFVVNIFAYVFIIMISLIAIANVFNTISTNVKLRRQELAMLRSVGMSDRDFNKMMRFECMFYGMRALLIGLPLAAVISWLIHKGMVEDEVRFTMPWNSVGISVFSVLLVIFITMMYAVRKIKKENIIDALRDDMT